MTMHLLKPHFNNIGNTKKKPTAAQIRAKAEHEKWLRENGVHPEQLASKPKTASRRLTSTVSASKSGPQCTNGFAAGGAKKSVFDSKWQRHYEDDPQMAEREAAALKAAEAKKANILPLYNKGGYQFAGNLKISELGKRRP